MTIKGLAITPPTIGRIAIGHMVEKEGRYLPEKDDAFTLTTQVQSKNGWILHPLHQELAEQAPKGKIRSIPITLLFDSPELNLRANYSAFDRASARPLCAGNGEVARRAGPEGVEEMDCPGPDTCAFGQEHRCKPFGRLNVRVEGQDDPLGSFIFRTSGFNSIRTLTARLRYFAAISGGMLSALPLALTLRAKSTAQSYRTPVYYVDLTLRPGMTLEQTIQQAKEKRTSEVEAGLNQGALDRTAELSLGNGSFEEDPADVESIVDEFVPESRPVAAQVSNRSTDSGTLAEKLSVKADRAATN
ncbi:hypothetical protein [Salinisphaera sp.]|uniref:recombination directionality factor n=1 Tax=Salinisphaera sp. TaxID=1914330 RepID=UPI000C4DCA5E|nr:hypothetical protein [Salinisphaera sp.]MAS08581.1 hypothetical protein [Salinisphaera sp.]|tara:strand:- start:3518 stop:4423 length:906 start_codon:yes stop_codon:yes gene_type:complete